MARHTAKSHKIRKVEILVIQTEIFILGPYLQKAENNLASKVLSKMRIGVILSL